MRLLREDDDLFTMHDGSREFRVAKRAISPELAAQIRGYSGESGDPTAQVVTPWGQQPQVDLSGGIDLLKQQQSDAANYVPTPVVAPAAPVVPLDQELSGLRLAQSMGLATPAGQERLAQLNPEPAKKEEAPVTAEPVSPKTSAPSVTPAVAPAVSGFKVPNLYGGISKQEKQDIENSANEQKKGIRGEAEQTALEQQANAVTQDKLSGALDLIQQDHQRRMAEGDARKAQLEQEIGSGNLDPNRVWHNMSTGQRIGSSIAMILSGIGSGMSGQPNMAAQMMEKSIDRDIDAQKSDLGRKESQISRLMQQGRDMESATMNAKAMAMDVASAQLKKTAAQYAGTKSGFEAMRVAGQIDEKSYQLREEAEGRHSSQAMQRAELQYKYDALRNAQLIAQNKANQPDKNTRAALGGYAEANEAVNELEKMHKTFGGFENAVLSIPGLGSVGDAHRAYEVKRTAAIMALARADPKVKASFAFDKWDKIFPHAHQISNPKSEFKAVKQAIARAEGKASAYGVGGSGVGGVSGQGQEGEGD